MSIGFKKEKNVTFQMMLLFLSGVINFKLNEPAWHKIHIKKNVKPLHNMS